MRGDILQSTVMAQVIHYNSKDYTLSNSPGSFYPLANEAKLIADILNPQRVGKFDAKCWHPTTYNAHDAREHKAQRERGQFPWLVFDLDDGNIDPTWIAGAIRGALGPCRPHAYSTHSSAPHARRGRIVVPLAYPVPGAWYSCVIAACIRAVANFTEAHGKLIALDTCTKREGQLFFGPNSNGVHYVGLPAEGPDLMLRADVLDEATQIKIGYDAYLARQTEPREAIAYDGRWIAYFNKYVCVKDLMSKAGFVTRNGIDWNHPTAQTSGSPSTRIFYGDRGCGWHTRSTTLAKAGLGVADALKTSATGDMFAIYRFFFAGNDDRLAVGRFIAEHRYGYDADSQDNLRMGWLTPDACLNWFEAEGRSIPWVQRMLTVNEMYAEEERRVFAMLLALRGDDNV